MKKINEAKKETTKFFKKKRKVDKRVYLFVIVVYAIFGIESVSKTIYEGSSAYLAERFQKTVIINEAVAKEERFVEANKKENVTCYDWADEFGGDRKSVV